jgi:hypothetical protein
MLPGSLVLGRDVGPGQQLVWRLVEPIHFGMEHKMLKGGRMITDRGRPADLRGRRMPSLESTHLG